MLDPTRKTYVRMENYICLLFYIICSCCFVASSDVDGCKDLETFVKEELKQLKEHNEYFNDKITRLEKENLEKRIEIQDLQEEIKLLKAVKGFNEKEKRQSRSNVAFTAYLAQHVHGITQSQPIVYDHVLLNDGRAYNSGTGKFTAPVSGVYLFSYSVGSKAIPGITLSQYDVFTRLVVNGVLQVSAVAESTATDDDEQGSTTAILFVLEGDQVWTTHEFKGGNNLYSSDIERITSFTGTLLYEKSASAIVG